MTKQGKLGQKKIVKILPKTLRLLGLLRYGHLVKDLAKYTGDSRQVVSYHLRLLQNQKMIYDDTPKSNKWKIFKLTELGQKVIGQYEGIEKKELKGVENARWISIIRKPKQIQKFLFENDFKMHQMENWIQWTGSIQGFTIAINQGKVTKMMITHPPTYANDLQQAYHKISENILNVVSSLNKKWNFDLTIPEPVPGRQFTMANDISEYLHDLSGGSQIKLKNGKVVIDASKHGEPRIEFTEVDEAHKFASMPDILGELRLQFQESEKKRDTQMEVVMQSITTLLKQNESTLDILTSIVTGKTQGKLEQKDSPEPFDDKFGMFG